FSTDRWVQAVRRGNRSDPAPLSLRLADGTTREYTGDYWVSTWSHENSSSIGQLHCALAALERWLCDLIDAGVDAAPLIDALLRTTNSVGVLGVLVNVGKYHDALFKGPLRPLLGVQQLYEWDFHRATENEYAFDAMTWARSGEVIFEMAKNWVFAPYRKRTLREIVPAMILADRELGDFVAAVSSQWTSPRTEKEALEFRMLVAALDYRNYSPAVDPATGKQSFKFAYPPDVAAGIVAFRKDRSRVSQALTFPRSARDVLNQTRTLNVQEAEWVALLMAAVDGDEEIDLDEEMMRPQRVAAAAVLLLRAPDWLAENAAVQQRAPSIIDSALPGIADESEARGPRILMASHLEFPAYFAVERWIAEPSKESDERVLRLLTSGDDQAVQALVWSAYRNREALGWRWWRLLYLALLWSGLSMLTPRYGDEKGGEIRWQRWRRWLRTRSLSAGNTTAASIDPLAVAERIERLERERWPRRYAPDGRRLTKALRRRLSGRPATPFFQHP